MRKKIITLGGATEDINIYPKEAIIVGNKDDLLRQKLLAFEYGAKISINNSLSTFGGGAANAAVNFSNLGFNSSILTILGKDERAKKILNNFKKRKVNSDLVIFSKDRETPFSLIVVGPKKEHVAFVLSGCKDDMEIKKNAERKIKQADWLYISSLSGRWEELLSQVIDLPKNIAWNPGSKQLKAGAGCLRKFLKKTRVICLNKDEAIELVLSIRAYKDRKKSFFNNINNLLKVIYSLGPDMVLITDGKKGATLYNGENVYKQGIIKEKKMADTTGVGDAFNSSFIAGLEIYSGDIKKSLFLAASNASSVVASFGAQNGLLNNKNI